MRARESTEAVISSAVAILVDGITVYYALLSAQWLRFHTPWIPMRNVMPDLTHQVELAQMGTAAWLLTFAFCGLYKRPQIGRFEDKIPRIVKAILYGIIAYFAMETLFRVEPQFSRPALVIGLGTLTVFVLLERYLIYRLEWNLARHMPKINRVLIIGTDAMALRLAEAIRKEPFLRSDIAGHLKGKSEADQDVTADQLIGSLDDLEGQLDQGDITQVILADLSMPHERMVSIIQTCEKRLVRFNLVPDIFRILTSGVVMQTVNGIPLIGLDKWPLDHVLNRIRNRAFDIAGALFGLLLFSPIIALFALLVKASSPGPVFYAQERLGEDAKPFSLYKLRPMKQDAEAEGQPGWTQENDPRRTKIGTFMRANNIDELPQFWNVLKGDMSLVGPRPERPFYVDQFKEMIDRYMIRHVFKPGLTGWAQVNGLRGDTSIDERIKYDLFYLENWSLSFDFKIILKTIFSRENAY